MHLSPLNLITIQARGLRQQYAEKADEKKASRRIEEVTMYRCPECSELHEWEDDARDCCKLTDSSNKSEDAVSCPICGEWESSHRDAADCCLWHDLDAPTRWAIADRVEDGSDWQTELGLAFDGRVQKCHA